MRIVFIIFIVLIAIVILYLAQDSLGARPSGKRLERIRSSENYRDGKFQNLSYTPPLTEGYSYWGVFYNFFFRKYPDLNPIDSIPSVVTDLKALPKNKNLLVWFGHSSYLLLIEGKTILVDPVLSGYASPFERFNKAFIGADEYKVEDLPEIDYLLITHDHYDHLDFETVKKLKGKVNKVVCGLGVGAHFEKWGYSPEQLIEEDWGANVMLDGNIQIHFTPARHFSGRSFFRDNTLWTSYVVETPSTKVYIGGDSGYDEHFKALGDLFGEFDLAILENGQYNEAWRYIHMFPEEVLQAGKDLNAKRIFPVHSGKFKLSVHPWNESLIKITELNKDSNLSLVTPMIGETVDLDDNEQLFMEWWNR